MGEAKPTKGAAYNKREGYSTVYVFVPIGRGLEQEVAACGPTEAGQDEQQANADLITEAFTVHNTTGLTPSQLVERVKELEEALQAAVDCGMVPKSSAADGGASKYSTQVLVADRIRAALSKARPNTAEGEAHAESGRGDATQPVALPCADCDGKGIDGDVDDYGRTIDVPCGACNGTGRTPSRYRDNCAMGGGRCLGGCLSSEPCYYAARKQAAAKEPSP